MASRNGSADLDGGERWPNHARPDWRYAGLEPRKVTLLIGINVDESGSAASSTMDAHSIYFWLSLVWLTVAAGCFMFALVL
jgi:hypothetical protein